MGESSSVWCVALVRRALHHEQRGRLSGVVVDEPLAIVNPVGDVEGGDRAHAAGCDLAGGGPRRGREVDALDPNRNVWALLDVDGAAVAAPRDDRVAGAQPGNGSRLAAA